MPLFKGLRDSSHIVCADSTKFRANRALEFCGLPTQMFLFANEQKLRFATALTDVLIPYITVQAHPKAFPSGEGGPLVVDEESTACANNRFSP